MNKQLDLLRHSDAALIEAHKTAAEHALLNHYESMAERERRAQWHREEAERIERLSRRTQ